MKKIITIALVSFVVSVNAQENKNTTYEFFLNKQKDTCRVGVTIGNIGGFQTLVQAPEYKVEFSLTPSQKANHKLIVRGVRSHDWAACDVNEEFYINKIISDEWNRVKSQFRGTIALECVNEAIGFYGGATNGPSNSNNLLFSVSDAINKNIFAVCDKISAIQLRKNVSCKLNATNESTTCSEGYYLKADPNARQIDFHTAVISALRGEEVTKGSWETTDAEKSRLQKATDEKNRREEEYRKKQEWLASPEGKRQIAAEEARVKKAEEDRQKNVAAEKARIARDFPYYAVFSCGMGMGHISIMACFSDYGSMEIKNGPDYGLYKIVQIANETVPNSHETREGFILNLRNNFSISAQNGGDRGMILGIKIIERSTNKIVYQKQVDRFGTIGVKN